MNPVSVDIKDKLVASHAGVFAATSGWSITIGVMPSEPATIISINDTGGPDPKYFLDRGYPPIENKAFSILFRAGSYLSAYAKAEAVKTSLETLGAFDVVLSGEGTVKYGTVSVSGNILYLGKDAQERFTFSVNFRVKRELEKNN